MKRSTSAARPCSPICSETLATGSRSISISRPTGRSSSSTPARSAAKGSSRSGSVRRTGWPRRPLAQGQEPVGACGTTRGRGGLRTSDGRPDDERRDDQAIAPFITLVGVARRAVVNDGDDTPECGYQAVEYLSQVETCSWSRSSSSANKACLFRNISRSQNRMRLGGHYARGGSHCAARARHS